MAQQLPLDVDEAALIAAPAGDPQVPSAGATAQAEPAELRDQIERLAASESAARRDCELLMGIIELMPVGLTVSDRQGALLLHNAAASTGLGASALGNSATDARSPPAGAAAQDGGAIRTEEKVIGGANESTWLISRRPVRFRDQDLLLSTAVDISERKRIENELARRAYCDDLTGLANRAMLEQHVASVLQARNGGGQFALAFIDLDNFKHINDYYNHAVGDALLVQVVQRISRVVRETDLLARISGDEFVLLVDPVEGDDQIRMVIDRLLEQLKQPFQLEGFEVFSSASIGVSIYPEHGATYEELRRNADSAMYRAKSGSKGAAAIYDLDMGRAVSARMELEQRLRLAIRDRQFLCAFQPKVDIRSQEVVGFETLVRWRDSNAEIQPPSSFIGLAIELGLIDPVTLFVLAEAIASIQLLDEAFGPGKSLAVNVSAKQAGDMDFMNRLVAILKESRCADRFIVEVTEDALIARNRFQSQVLPMLRDIGVRVSIDDFGTGYSSLSVLADITVDEIKIDRSFITDIHQRPRSQSILKAIESVSSALGVSVVAEGVESFEELVYLLGATRIRYAQGYHFARPFLLEEGIKTFGANADQRAVQPDRQRAERRQSSVSRAFAGTRRE